MKKFAVSPLQGQGKVHAYFQAQSSYWKDIYTSGGVQGEIYRDRHATALDWIDSLTLAPSSQVLEIGCGAGFMAIALAQHRFHVHAIDSSKAMLKQACQHAATSGATDLLSLDIGDVYALDFEDNRFDLVIAIGVIPWLERPELALQEMARVTRPGGHVILTADNRARLNNRLDPWLNPALVPLKQHIKATIKRIGLYPQSWNQIGATFHDQRFIDAALARAKFVKIRSMTLGFGPFSLLRHKIFPEPFGITLHHQLQRLANRNLPGFRSTGAHYLVLARNLDLVGTNLCERPEIEGYR